MARIKITSKQANGSAIINAGKKIIVFFIGVQEIKTVIMVMVLRN